MPSNKVFDILLLMKSFFAALAKKTRIALNNHKEKMLKSPKFQELADSERVKELKEMTKKKFNQLDQYLSDEKLKMNQNRSTNNEPNVNSERITMDQIREAPSKIQKLVNKISMGSFYDRWRTKVKDRKGTPTENNNPAFKGTYSENNIRNYASSDKINTPSVVSSQLNEWREKIETVINQTSESGTKYSWRERMRNTQNMFSPFSNLKQKLFRKTVIFLGCMVFCYSFAKHLALSMSYNRNIEKYMRAQQSGIDADKKSPRD
jgi:hypothetical protein